MKKNKTNIWFFNHYAVSPDSPGGTRHYDFAEELAKRGYNMKIFASSFHYQQLKETNRYENKYYKEERIGDVDFVWIKTPSYKNNNWRRIVNMLSFCMKIYFLGRKFHLLGGNKPDILIGSSPHPFAALSGYFLSVYYKVPFVFEVRDLWPQSLIDLGIMSKYHPLILVLRTIEKFLYKKSNKIISLLPNAKKYIMSLGIKETKIEWIPNGVNMSRFKAFPIKKEGKFCVLYAGAHGMANGLHILMEAAKMVGERGYDDIEFRLVGDGLEKQKLIEKTAKEGLKNVIFKESVKKAQVASLLQQVDVLFFSLVAKDVFKYGISSNKLFGYLAAGKPIIFSSDSSNNPVAEANAGISVKAENSRAIADAVIKLYNCSEKNRNEMGRRGREYVEKFYTIPVLVDKLVKVIREIDNNIR